MCSKIRAKVLLPDAFMRAAGKAKGQEKEAR
jgi:hypothetical protein